MESSQFVLIKHQENLRKADIKLVSSKSESNRALIINALASSSGLLGNLSEARDTQTMMRLLASETDIWDVLDAGTTMRFLTAFAAINGMQKTLTGTERMQQRPIKILVDALRELGVEIQYLKQEGFPPHRIIGFEKQQTRQIKVQGDVSSQYISALCMVAPRLPEGLTIELTGKIGSRPYIEMTLALMRKFGAEVSFEGNIITISPKGYKESSYVIESDWSGASYWFSFVALANQADIKLLGLREDSLQGDKAIVGIMEKIGVKATFEGDGVRLTKKDASTINHIDFSHCPDLAQTVCVALAAQGIACEMTGLESLKIKETDRIAALQNELGKFGGRLEEIDLHHWRLIPSTENISALKNITIETYDDHRMAMAFAPLAMKTDVKILNPSVVNKSYPGYWDDLRSVGLMQE